MSETDLTPSNNIAAISLALPHGVTLIRYEPLQAPVRLSECTVVVNVAGFIEVTLRELNHELCGRHWLAGNWGLAGLLNRLKSVGVEIDNDVENGGAQ
jgi:hypothetical protein